MYILYTNVERIIIGGQAMTNEQREAIEFLEFYKQHCLKKEIENMDNYETIHDGDFVSKNLDIVLSLIKEQQEEIEKKDKQIDLMAELVYKRFKAELLLEYGFENEDQLKQYFAELVEKE